jgi:hypothetical protein
MVLADNQVRFAKLWFDYLCRATFESEKSIFGAENGVGEAVTTLTWFSGRTMLLISGGYGNGHV